MTSHISVPHRIWQKKLFQWNLVPKNSILWPIKAKNPFWGSEKWCFSKFDPKFWKLWFFWYEKWPCFLISAKIRKNDFFCPKKHVLAILGGFRPYDMSFLWSQSSGFEPNFQNLVRKSIFGPSAPVRLATLEKSQKIPKNAIFGSIPLLMVSYAKNSYKFCLTGVSGHFGAKLIKKISNFDFSHFHLIFEKKISRSPKYTILGSDSWLDDFSIKF